MRMPLKRTMKESIIFFSPNAAMPFFKEAIQLSSNFPEPHFNMGISLAEMGKDDEAAEAFKNAKKFGTDDPRIMKSEVIKKHLDKM